MIFNYYRMLTKSKLKLLKSLQVKKNRAELGLYLIEGMKVVKEYLKINYPVLEVYYTSKAVEELSDFMGKSECLWVLCTPTEIDQISSLENNEEILALVKQAKHPFPTITQVSKYLALDRIKDPGNMGTIIRTADWFGMQHVFCSEDSVDCYNPKTVSASKGSLSRVQVHYTDLQAVCHIFSGLAMPIYGAFLDGNTPDTMNQESGGLLVLGSESHGIDSRLEGYISQRIHIPGKGSAESLNVGVAAGILMYHLCKHSHIH